MFELVLLMLAVAMQSAQPAGPAQHAAVAIAVPSVADTDPAAIDDAAAPPAAPAFLAPAAEPAADAAPVFLAPESEPALVAEPQVPSGRFTTATEVKPILDVTRNNWILVRDFNGQDLVYVTHLWSWRCGLLELRVGLNGAAPEPWPLPPCHLDQPAPNAILESDGLPYRAFPPGSVSMVEIQLTYDDLSTDGARFNRQGMPVP